MFEFLRFTQHVDVGAHEVHTKIHIITRLQFNFKCMFVCLRINQLCRFTVELYSCSRFCFFVVVMRFFMVYNICVCVQVICCNVLNTFPELVLIIVLITKLWICCFKTDMLLMFVCIWNMFRNYLVFVRRCWWFSELKLWGECVWKCNWKFTLWNSAIFVF